MLATSGMIFAQIPDRNDHYKHALRKQSTYDLKILKYSNQLTVLHVLYFEDIQQRIKKES